MSMAVTSSSTITSAAPSPTAIRPAARVLPRVVERLLRRLGAAALVAGELLRAERHLVEQAQLRAEEDPLHRRVVAPLERRVRDVVELHEAVEAHADLAQQPGLMSVA